MSIYVTAKRTVLRALGRAPINWIERRYAYGKEHYGEKNIGKCNRLKRRIKQRLFVEHGVKPRVRVHLNKYYNWHVDGVFYDRVYMYYPQGHERQPGRYVDAS